MEEPKLSIMIATMAERAELLAALAAKLLAQAPEPIEILTDDRGVALAEKRNDLLARARGRFVACIDDDDDVAENYVPAILAAIGEDPEVDVVTFRGVQTDDGEFAHDLVYTNRVREPFDAGRVRCLPPTHICAIRRDVAVQSRRWAAVPCGTDDLYWRPLHAAGRFRRERFIDEALYFYRFSRERTGAQKAGQVEAARAAGPHLFFTFSLLANLPHSIFYKLPSGGLDGGAFMDCDGEEVVVEWDLLAPLCQVEIV